MDPNEALRVIREMMAPFSDPNERYGDVLLASGDDYCEHCQCLGEVWAVLDNWLSTGGFLPEAWERKSKVPTQEEAFASGIHGENSSHFAMRVAMALTKEYVADQRRILMSLADGPNGVLLDEEDQMACVHLEELKLITVEEEFLDGADGHEWRTYHITEAGAALVEHWRKG